MIEQSSVFDAVRRGYSELSFASEEQILNHFAAVETESMVGHAANIKGILFEQQVSDYLNDAGLKSALFEATNHPDADILIEIDGYLPLELQLKATDSVSYINQTLADNPDIAIITTSELADRVDSEMVLDSGIANAELDEIVYESLFTQELANLANPGSIEDPISGIANFGADFHNLSDNSFLEEGLAEAVTEMALPISPLGVVLGFFGIPFT